MKRISIWLAVLLFAIPVAVRAQDAATEERLNKLTAQIQDLVEAQGAQNKRIEALTKEIQAMQQEQSNKPTPNFASQEDVKELTAKLKEVDRKRQEDNDHVLTVLKKLGTNLGAGTGKKTAVAPKAADEPTAKTPGSSETVFEHVVKAGQTPSAILQAYRDEKKTKATMKQLMEANPGLKPEKVLVGQKIFIPVVQ